MTYCPPTTYYYNNSCKGSSYNASSISGRYSLDANRDNTERNGAGFDAGLGGKKVFLLDSYGRVVASTTTGDDGSYKFAQLKAGSYSVSFETMSGHSFAAKDIGDGRYDSDVNSAGKTDVIKLGSCQNVCDIDASVQRDTGKISGSVFSDIGCDGINGQVKTTPGACYVLEAEAMCKTGSLGTFAGHQASGGKFVKLNCGSTGTLADNFAGKAGTYDVVLRLQDECDGRSTITLKVDGCVVQAVRLDRDNNGGGDDNGAFQDFVIKGVKLNAGSKVELLVNGDAGEFVRLDKVTFQGAPTTTLVAEPPKAGVKIVLLDSTGATVATTYTDAAGNYKFDNVPTGQYRVMGEAPDGTKFTLKDAGSNDSIDSDVGSNGQSDLITVTKDGHTDIDLGLCEIKEGALEGRYFFDADRGNTDNGDVGVAGKVVTLYAANGTTVIATTLTDANGFYSFTKLAPGSYVVGFEDSTAEDRSFVTANVGADDTIDSDASAITGKTAPVSVVAGQTTKDVDVGVSEDLGALEGRYFFDAGRDNTDNGDAGVSGKTVTLYAANGTTVIATTLTGADGSYAFTGLVAGSYVVGFEDSTAQNRAFVTQDQGGDNTIDSDANVTTGKTAPVAVLAGQTTKDVDVGVLEIPGALEGRYFFDAGRDDTDNGDAGVEGKLVTLYAADGVTVVATTLTAADGTYAFTGLVPGAYVVGFADSAAEGRAFVAQDIGGDDTIDSDANATTGVTGVVAVLAGQTTKDVDVGVYQLNKAPIAVDDATEICADETGTLDLLANDSDPDFGPLSVVSIFDEDEVVTAGGTMTLASGAKVTLNANGTVTYDGIAAYAGLLLGEHAMDSFGYTVTDGEDTATAAVDIEVCGALNTPETIDARTFEGATASFTVGIFNGSTAINGFSITLNSINIPDDFNTPALTIENLGGPGFQAAYCIDYTQEIDTRVLTDAKLMVATEANALSAGLTAAAAANIDTVNWLLNQNFTSVNNGDGNNRTYTDMEVQEAIYVLLNGDTFFINNPDYGTTFVDDNDGVRENNERATEQNAQEIAALALANGDGFQAGAGDILGLILDPTAPVGQDQPFIFGVQFNLFVEDCLCA